MSLPPTEGTQLPATTRPSTARRARDRATDRPKRPWPVTANALLLLAEAGGFALMGALHLLPLGVLWPLSEALWNTQRAAVVTGFVFALLAVLALAAAIGFGRVAPGAWLLAVLVQGLNLALALVLYFKGRPDYVYLMMLIGVLMVLYLHQSDVQAAFRPPAANPEEAGAKR
jgi:hypothetical protein